MKQKSARNEFLALRDYLIADGWKTPDTYSNHFAAIESLSAVYLFLMVSGGSFDSGVVAYVGMSTNLKQRLSAHEIFAQIDRPEVWVMRWFKPVPQASLREVEAAYIAHFNPPWNIIGRPRGMVLQ